MITIFEIISYALVDAINPCALAVMIIVLMNLLIEDKIKRKKVLYGGLAFSFSVFLLYLIYGFFLIFIFKSTLPETGGYSDLIFKLFGFFALILGILNIKDYLNYKPGGLATEMPLFLRPKMKLWVKKIRTPKGAFIIGLIVTLFLLPCTIGPYVIASARLSSLPFITILYWLLIYNLIFILPMISITIFIYLGVTSIENIGGWKEKNLKKIHLLEGLILIILGILMVTGII